MDQFPKQPKDTSDIEQREASQKARDEAVAVLGSRFHEEWRKSRLNKDGMYEPRLKNTKDAQWSAIHGGTTEVDIANTSYEDLPSDWQADNKAAATAVVAIIEEMGFVDLEDPEVCSMVGNVIHDEWLSRNGEWAPEEQRLPFDELSEEEKAKDIDQMRIAKEVFGV